MEMRGPVVGCPIECEIYHAYFSFHCYGVGMGQHVSLYICNSGNRMQMFVISVTSIEVDLEDLIGKAPTPKTFAEGPKFT